VVAGQIKQVLANGAVVGSVIVDLLCKRISFLHRVSKIVVNLFLLRSFLKPLDNRLPPPSVVGMVDPVLV